jgi:hypothetical protein
MTLRLHSLRPCPISILLTLFQIAEVKGTLDDEDESEAEEQDQPSGQSTALIMLGRPSSVTKEFLLKSVPPRPIAEHLLWHWFNSADPGLPAVHRPSFLEMFEKLWTTPSEVPTMWLSHFFSILCLGSRNAAYSIENQPDEQMIARLGSADHYQELSAAALALADYTKPKRHTVEALMAHATCEYLKQDDSHLRLWLLMGVVLRVALRMGYHRDASHFPKLSPFEGEMRRRVWTLVYVFDVLESYQLGLPR